VFGPVWELTGVSGTWVEGSPMVVAVSEDGELVRWRAGEWSVVQVPRIGEDVLLDVFVDEAGRVVVAGRTGGVYRLDGEVWSTLAYPVGVQNVVALSGRADGRFIVLAADGALAQGLRDAGQLERIVMPDMPAEPSAAWLGAQGLWVAGSRELVRIDTGRWRGSSRVRHGLFGQVRVLAGYTVADGERAIAGAQSEFVEVVGKQVRPLPFTRTFPAGISFDWFSASVLVAAPDGVSAHRHDPLLAAREQRLGLRRDCRLPSGRTTLGPEDLVRAVPEDRSTERPAPARALAPTPEELAAATGKRRRLSEKARPTLRVGFGGAYARREPAVPGASRTLSGFTLDASFGLLLPVHRRVTLWPELGYNFATRGGKSGHFFTAGLATMFGGESAKVGLVPRLVTGDAWGTSGTGVRSGLMGSFVHDVLTIEVGHQWLRAGGRDLHDGRFMISVEMTALVATIAVFSLARAIFR